MTGAPARLEFRAFAQTFGLVGDRIRQRGACSDISESIEAYIIATDLDDQNVKIRNGRLEVKRLLERRGRLERWRPTATDALPVSSGTLRSRLGVGDLPPGRSTYAAGQLLAEVVRPHPGLRAATVRKTRFRYTIDECPVEIDDVIVNGASIRSVAVESEHHDAILAVLASLGLGDYENTSYPRAIRRIVGLEPWPKELVPDVDRDTRGDRSRA